MEEDEITVALITISVASPLFLIHFCHSIGVLGCEFQFLLKLQTSQIASALYKTNVSTTQLGTGER